MRTTSHFSRQTWRDFGKQENLIVTSLRHKCLCGISSPACSLQLIFFLHFSGSAVGAPKRMYELLGQRGCLQMSQFIPHLSIAQTSVDFVCTCGVTHAALGLPPRHTYVHPELLYGATHSPAPREGFPSPGGFSSGIPAVCSLTCPSTQVKQTPAPTKFLNSKQTHPV